MVQLSSFLVSLLLLAASVANPLKRTVAQIEADIATITTQVTTLHSAVQAFPASGSAGIHTDASLLETTVNRAAADITATGPLSEADASTIINSIVALEPTMLDALQQLIVKEPNFVTLPVGGFRAMIHTDLLGCVASETALAQALSAVVPVDLQAKLTGLTNVSTALDAAVFAYSGLSSLIWTPVG
ncbi:hydrophobic surface binding protein [Mycena leptocephala]|nr:hydrophobic surface binding protein [Mycena leptocephala]